MVMKQGWGSRLWAKTTARVEREKSREMPSDALIKTTPLTGPQKGVPGFRKMSEDEFKVYKSERVRQIYEDNRTQFGLLEKKSKEEKPKGRKSMKKEASSLSNHIRKKGIG